MKKHFRSRHSVVGFSTEVAAILGASFLAFSPSAHAALMLEPMGLACVGSSSSSLMTSGSSYASGGAGLRFGVEKDDYFSALEGRYEIGNPGGGGQGSTLSFGVVGGVNFTYVPFRLQLGFNFSDSYSDSYMSAGGAGFTAGIGWLITEHTVLNVGYIYHAYDQFTAKVQNLNIGAFSANAATVYLSFPLTIELPTEPWRKKREIEATHGPRAEMPEAAPAPMPEAAPPAEAPPAETPPATPPDETPKTEAAPQPESPAPAPQAETPTIPQPQGTENVPPPPAQ